MRDRAPASAAERKAAHRARGRQVAVILTDQAAIAALDQLSRRYGSQRAAIEIALQLLIQR